MSRTKTARLALLAVVWSTACSGPVTTTITATVVDEFGTPAPGRTVIITSGTFSQVEKTDVNGQFTVAKVPTPYDATLVSNPWTVYEYVGLTRGDPVLSDPLDQGNLRDALLQGQLAGGVYPEPTSGEWGTQLMFASPQVVDDLLDFSSGGFGNALDWTGPPSTTGTIYALQIHYDAGLPVDYPGYGALSNVVVPDRGMVTGQTVNLASVTSGTLTGTATTAPGYGVASIELWLVPARAVFLALLSPNTVSAGTPFTYTTPSISNTSLSVTAIAENDEKAFGTVEMDGLSANASVALTVPAAPTLSLPENGATGVNFTTEFSWMPAPGAVYILHVSAGRLNSSIYTAAPTATLPDLTSVGISFLPSVPGGWRVTSVAPVASIDAIAGPGGISAAVGDVTVQGYSAGRQFTTSP